MHSKSTGPSRRQEELAAGALAQASLFNVRLLRFSSVLRRREASARRFAEPWWRGYSRGSGSDLHLYAESATSSMSTTHRGRVKAATDMAWPARSLTANLERMHRHGAFGGRSFAVLVAQAMGRAPSSGLRRPCRCERTMSLFWSAMASRCRVLLDWRPKHDLSSEFARRWRPADEPIGWRCASGSPRSWRNMVVLRIMRIAFEVVIILVREARHSACRETELRPKPLVEIAVTDLWHFPEIYESSGFSDSSFAAATGGR